MGANYAVDPAEDNLPTKVQSITDGKGAQIVFNTTPIGPLAKTAIECLGRGGTAVLYSSFYPDQPMEISPDLIHKNALRIMGTANSGARDFVVASKLISSGIVDVKPLISTVLPFAQLDEALRLAASGQMYRVAVKM